MDNIKSHKHYQKPGNKPQGGVRLDCDKNRNGKACPISGVHIAVQCRCGAIGIICPRCERIAWHSR